MCLEFCSYLDIFVHEFADFYTQRMKKESDDSLFSILKRFMWQHFPTYTSVSTPIVLTVTTDGFQCFYLQKSD